MLEAVHAALDGPADGVVGIEVSRDVGAGVGRLLDGALNDAASAVQDSFEDGLLDCPHFTRSEALGTKGVPEVLLSGDHAKIRQWRHEQSLRLTQAKRPDLLAKKELSDKDRELLQRFAQSEEQSE